MPDEIRDHDEKIIDRAIDGLMMHFDSVEVFVTRLDGDGKTTGGAFGRGNWYARYGQIQSWVENGGALTNDDPDDD